MATEPNVTHFPVGYMNRGLEGRPLATKMARVLAEVTRVPKKGRNDFHGYDYVMEADLVDHIRDKLAEQGVAIFPSVREHKVEEMEDARKRSVYLTTVELDVTLIDGESGDVMTTTWIGQGLDNGDKGYYKAYTGAIKYFLLKTFLISTGDDPELDDAPRPVANKSRKKAAPKAKAKGANTDAPRDEKAQWAERNEEFTALLEEAVDTATREEFVGLYVARMGAKDLEGIDATKLSAMCRKLRGMNRDARKKYVEGVIEENASK